MTRDISDSVQKKLLGMLGLAARAAKLTFGSELTHDGLSDHRVYLVLLSTAASARTRRKLEECCAKSGVDCLHTDIDPFEISHATGQKRPIVSLGIIDPNFASAVKRIYETTAPLTPQTITESEV